MSGKTNAPSAESSGWLPRIWAAFLLVLIAATHRLWIPDGPLPAVPLVSLPAAIATTMGWGSIAALVIALSVGLFRASSAAWWVVAISLATSFVLDQHRLQPWAYQSMVYAALFASMPPQRAQRWIVAIAISIYLYSGIGKLDHQFAHTVGQQMLGVVAAPFGGLAETLSESTRVRIALLLPITECLLGVGLILRRTRRIAGVGVIVMHLALIGVLGPWGLNHSGGVLIWNLLLIVQAWLLFVRRGAVEMDRIDGETDVQTESDVQTEGTVQTGGTPRGGQSRRRRFRCDAALAATIAIVALLMPLGERWGYWDHWPSWALYAPHSSRVEVEFHPSQFDQLDPTMLDMMEPDHDLDGWQRLDLSRWSLESLGVPIYPQARYQLDLVREVADRCGLSEGVRAQILGPADRLSGERSKELAIGPQDLDRVAGRFWLAVQPELGKAL